MLSVATGLVGELPSLDAAEMMDDEGGASFFLLVAIANSEVKGLGSVFHAACSGVGGPPLMIGTTALSETPPRDCDGIPRNLHDFQIRS